MKTKIPRSLRIWFLIHFMVDILIGFPLLVLPERTLELIMFEHESYLFVRLVGAALIGIGVVSLVMHNAGRESYHALLLLKLTWSAAAIIALMVSIWAGAPVITWLALIIFLGFFIVWEHYYKRLFSK
jgi:hypothetical protein